MVLVEIQGILNTRLVLTPRSALGSSHIGILVMVRNIKIRNISYTMQPISNPIKLINIYQVE